MLSTIADSGLFGQYSLTGYDEMFAALGRVRPHYVALRDRLGEMGGEELASRDRAADLIMRHQGITFTVYGKEKGVEQIIPFDPIPRLIAADEWERIERGLEQRVRALNHFIHDVYHERLILRDRTVPPELVLGASGYRRECVGLRVPKDIYIHISGIDLIRDASGTFLVLEDNGRCPSGVSYVLKNRQVMKQVFPRLFQSYNVRPVDDYAANLLAVLHHIAPSGCDDPTVAVLTPGVYNSAYYEHSYLARQMGVELVEGRDLFLDASQVFMRTIRGPKRVDVLYRRIDDDYLDPLTFRRDSQLGVTGLAGAYRMLIGPASTAAQRDEFARKVEANPRGYVAQPTIALSQHPTLIDGHLEGRHVDLRPFVLFGEEVQVLGGGLTRVALPRGNLVVNSSQGGGTKDTWVLRAEPPEGAGTGAGAGAA